MPIHDWTCVAPGAFHDFHQDWTIEIRRTLNRGLLPPGYSAMFDEPVNGPEPDVIAFEPPEPSLSRALSVADAPPRARYVATIDMRSAAYARKAKRIAIRHELGHVVAI